MMSLPYYSGDLGDGAAVDITLDQMFGDHDDSHSGDLFELVWACAAGGGAGEIQYHAGAPCCHRRTAAAAPEMPPSEDEMAAWLSEIVTGSGNDDHQLSRAAGGEIIQAPAVESGERRRMENAEKLPRKEEKPAKHKARRNPRYAETHGLTEKRRRSRINEKFKMLQQLVPGCDKSSQSSTLDRTIHYMKSLQQQLQGPSGPPGLGIAGLMPNSVGLAMYATVMRPAAAAVYPAVVQPRPAPFVPSPAAVGVVRLPLPWPSRSAPALAPPAEGGRPVVAGGLPHPAAAPVVPFGAPMLPLVPMMAAAGPGGAPPLMYPPSTSIYWGTGVPTAPTLDPSLFEMKSVYMQVLND
uniref:BHLH domain-containing protein n=1 Tax=Oryza brachyantha TaxID=4533 RepID=J3NEQ4_ORYBR